MQVIKDLDHYYVVVLEDSEKINPTDNYGIYNKEFDIIDMRTESEQAARALAEQHEFAKKAMIKRDAELELEIKSSKENVTPLSKRAH